MDFEQPIGHMNSVIGVDPDHVSIEGRMMELGQRQAVRDHRLSLLLGCIGEGVGGVHQSRLGQMEVPHCPR